MFKERIESQKSSPEELLQQEEVRSVVAKIESSESSEGVSHFLNEHPRFGKFVRAAILTGSLGGISSSAPSSKSTEQVAHPPVTEQTRDIDRFWQEQAAKNPDTFFIYGYEKIEDTNLQDKLLEEAAAQIEKTNPETILLSIYKFSDRPWFEKFFKRAAFSNSAYLIDTFYYPDSIKRESSLVDALKKVDGHAMEAITRLAAFETGESKTGSQMYPPKDFEIKRAMSALLEKIAHANLSLDEAIRTVKDTTSFFHALLDIQKIPNHLGEKTVTQELDRASLRVILKLNMLHEEPDEVRFKSVEDISPEEIYALITHGEEEVFTSTFNGLFNRMLEKMRTTHLSGDALLQGGGANFSRTFLKLCSEYNRLSDFLETMNPEAQKVTLENFIQELSLDKEEALSQTVSIAESIDALHDPNILTVLDQKIHSEYMQAENKNDTQGKLLYGLLASVAQKNAVTDTEWFTEMKEKYEISPLDEIQASQLFDEQERDIQQYFFYNDEDGENSFKSFLGKYEGSHNWKIEKNEDYVHIESVGSNKKIEIYANYPKTDNNGIEKMKGVLSGEGKQPQVIVHRGHSYHASETIKNIPDTAKIVVLGSCGGYRNIDGVLEKSHGAHILSTKGTGTMQVNDPLLKMLDQHILQGDDIVWKDFWAEAEKHLGKNPDFKNYISPDKNLGVLLIRAYNEQMDKITEKPKSEE